MSEISGGPLGERDLQKALAKIRFGSPWAPEWRDYFRELDDWFFGGRGGSAPEGPLDVLEPFRQAWGHPPPPKRLVSIRVDEWLLALVKEMGRQVGMPYQEIVRIWMEDGMRRALTDGLREPEPTSLRSRENKNHRALTARRPLGPPAP